MITKTAFNNAKEGGTIRTAAIVAELRRAGFSVDAFAVRGAGQAATKRRMSIGLIRANLRVLTAIVGTGSLSVARWYSPAMVRSLHEASGTGKYLVNIIEYSQLFIYRSLMGRSLVLDLHNIESELLSNYATSARQPLSRLAAKYEANRMRRLESTIAKSGSVIFVVSDHDRDLLAELGNAETPTDVVLASNGVGPDGFLAEFERRDTVVFVAHLGWRPNIDAARWLATRVWPLVIAEAPGLVLQIIGRSPSDDVRALASESIEVHADVDNVVAFVARARVATAPLLAAGGTRLKILEALSCGTPVVATSLGALGLESLVGKNTLAIADEENEFARQILRLVDVDISAGETRVVVESYRWASTLAPLVSRVKLMR